MELRRKKKCESQKIAKIFQIVKNPSGSLQSRPPNHSAPKLRNSQFGSNDLSWKFLAHTLNIVLFHYSWLQIEKMHIWTITLPPSITLLLQFHLIGQAWKECQNKNGCIRRTVADAIQNGSCKLWEKQC